MDASVATHKKDFSIRTTENSNSRRVASSNNLSHLAGDDDSDAHDADSEGSSDDEELFEFDVYEREGYDRIIQAVSGGQHQDDFARQVCRHLELFESLAPGRSVSSSLPFVNLSPSPLRRSNNLLLAFFTPTTANRLDTWSVVSKR